MGTEKSEEQKRGAKEERKSLKNGRRTEKSDEYTRRVQTKNGKERAAGEEKIELHLYYVIGRAGHRREKDIAGRRCL